jgi:uncharacterized protein (DUF433 family)
MGTALTGIIHGKSIELSQETGLPEGQEVSVEIRPVPGRGSAPVFDPAAPLPLWLERFDVDPAVKLGKFIVKGTHLLADDLVQLVEDGRSDDEIQRLHPELTSEDVDAVRHYSHIPRGLRRACGAWAEDAEELDNYLDWNRQQRKLGRREIGE